MPHDSPEPGAVETAAVTQGRPDHRVHFYDDEAALFGTAVDFLAEGIESRQAVVVIATPPRVEAFAERLRERGCDPDGARSRGEYTVLDAHATLDALMVGDMPDRSRFAATVETLIQQQLETAASGVRAYGEMVDVLWRDGRRAAAIRLEEFWHDLAGRRPLSLLCAYPFGPSYNETGRRPSLTDVCAVHSSVVTGPSSEAAQRTRALEAEVAHRRQLEGALRSALAERDRMEAQHRRATRHLAADYAVMRILAEPLPFSQIVPPLLHAICEVGDWELGALWSADETAGGMRCIDVWHAAGEDFEAFARATRGLVFQRGVGLPGRIWATGAPAWIEDVIQDPNFPRAPYAARAGLRAAFGFPIRVRGHVTGVLEFFSRETRGPEDDLLRFFDVIGTQVGQFIERREIDELRDRLAAIVDSSEDAIVSKTLDGVIRSWNRGAEHIFGYSAEEAVGRHVTLIIPPERHAEEDAVLARLRRGERIEHFETERRTKDGRTISISLTVSPVRDADGTIVGASKVVRDITERKRVAQAERARAQLADVLNRVGTAVAATLDRESIVQTVTDLATEVTTAEFGAFFYDVVDRESGEAVLLHTLSGAPKEAFGRFPDPRATPLFGPTFRGEAPIRLDDVAAEHLPVRSYLAVPVKSRTGDVLGGLFFGHSAPGVFTAHHEQLVTGIAAWASIALENARLFVQSTEAVHARDEFLSLASHELRNPLNALQLQLVGLLRAARDRGESLPAAWVCERLAHATADVGRLVRLVHNLLDVARITAGRIVLEPEDLDLAATVRVVADRFRDQLADGQLVLRLDPLPGRWDRLAVDQIVTNLLSNAIKYGERQPIDIAVRGDGDRVELTVTDRGIGIDPAQQARLFQRFERAVQRREFGGFGLGLWIARETARAMGGTIDVESAPGDGSTFRVTLPRIVEGGAGARPS